MSKLSEYSKFDNLVIDDDDDDSVQGDNNNLPVATLIPSVPTTAEPVATTHHIPHPTLAQRFIFQHQGHTVYEWEQTMTDVNLFIVAPGPPVVCTLQAHHIKVGLKGSDQYFLDEDTHAAIEENESTWCLEEEGEGQNKMIVLYLHKAAKGLVWPKPLSSTGTLDPASLTQVRQALLRERWQEENPGMDFRDAEFNGSVPDPRTFMGGVQYK